jgi:hypothetical protein
MIMFVNIDDQLRKHLMLLLGLVCHAAETFDVAPQRVQLRPCSEALVSSRRNNSECLNS